MDAFPWDVAAILGLLIGSTTYIIVAILIYAHNE